MVTNKSKKLTEDLVEVQMKHIDSMFLQDEFSQMQVAICSIIEQLSVTDLSETQIDIIYNLNAICNAILDQISANISAQEL